MHPRNREIVAFFGGKAAASLAGGLQRRVINFATFDHCNALIEQSGQRAQDARLCLPSQTEKDDVVFGEDGVVQRRNHRAVVAVNAGKGSLTAGDFRQQVLAHFLFDRSDFVAGVSQLAQRMDIGHVVSRDSLSESRLNSFIALRSSPRAKRTSASTARSMLRLTIGSSLSSKSSRT